MPARKSSGKKLSVTKVRSIARKAVASALRKSKKSSRKSAKKSRKSRKSKKSAKMSPIKVLKTKAIIVSGKKRSVYVGKRGKKFYRSSGKSSGKRSKVYLSPKKKRSLKGKGKMVAKKSSRK